MDDTVRFYFSFRSPYAWFAAERWQAELGDLNPVVEKIPFYPTRETFPNDPTLHPAKYAHVIQDVRRCARDYDLVVRPPAALDTDWETAHAAYLGVRLAAPARADAFLLEMFRARFSRGLDVALPEVIGDAAARAGVDPTVAAEGATSTALKSEVARNFTLGRERDGIFGAPSFVHRGQLYWGHDRMHHLRRALVEAARERPAEARA